MKRCTSSPATSVPYILCIGPISSSCSNCTTDHPHVLHFHRNTQQWAISDNVITEGSCWKTPALCFLRTPIFVYLHDSSSIDFRSKDASWFLSVTSSLSLMSSLFAPISLIHLGSAFWFHSKTGSNTICASPCLPLCYILNICFRLTSCRTTFSAPIFLPHKFFSIHHGACLSILLQFSFVTWLWQDQTKLLLSASSYSCFDCPLSQISRLDLFQKHLLNILQTN